MKPCQKDIIEQKPGFNAGDGFVLTNGSNDSFLLSIKEILESKDVQPEVFDELFNVISEFLESSSNKFMKLAAIGTALSSESNMDKILEMILDEARELTRADAGTLYTVSSDNTALDFAILHNSTMNTRMGGTSGAEINLPPVPLVVNGGSPNMAHVSAYCVHTRRVVNIEDVYVAKEFDFTGPRKYDEATGYRTQSMLVIPMLNHEDEVIGVLQLLNSLDDEKNVAPFSQYRQDLALSLASQAAVTLTNTQLIHDLRNLFDAFIQSIATAIDAKSSYTSGHIQRVAELTMMIADAINNDEQGAFKEFSFTSDEMEELKIAAWLHDVGKITTPEHIMDKSTRLETVSDGIELVKTRFNLFRQAIVCDYQAQKIDAPKSEHTLLDADMKRELDEIDEELNFIISCNNPVKFMRDEDIERLKKLSQKKKKCIMGEACYLTPVELDFLTVRKGSLTMHERSIIEHHALMTQLILDKLPFPKKMAKATEYASHHHEKPDGSGYPNGASGEKLSLQARILAVADIFEALTASDRPYKPAMSIEKAISILEDMKNHGKIDEKVFRLFQSSEIYKEYSTRHLAKRT